MFTHNDTLLDVGDIVSFRAFLNLLRRNALRLYGDLTEKYQKHRKIYYSTIYINFLGSVIFPVTALAATTNGDAKTVRAPGP